MSESSTTPNSKLSQRRWFWPSVAAVGIGLGVAWVAWVAWSNVPPFQTQTHSFEVTSDEAISVTFNVYGEEPLALSCKVLAQTLDKNVVGEKTLTVPSPANKAEQKKTTITVDLRTSGRATTGYVDSCELLD